MVGMTHVYTENFKCKKLVCGYNLSLKCGYLAPVVQKVDSAIRWINLYPLDSAIGFPNTYPLDSDLSRG